MARVSAQSVDGLGWEATSSPSRRACTAASSSACVARNTLTMGQLYRRHVTLFERLSLPATTVRFSS